MTRDEFKDKLQGLISLAYQDQIHIMDLWGVLSDQLKLVELMLEIEFMSRYRKTEDDDNHE